jgi:hypothetical protein
MNADIKEKRNTAVIQTRQLKLEVTATPMATLQQWIRQSKSTMWTAYLYNLWGTEVWTAAQYPYPFGRHDC